MNASYTELRIFIELTEELTGDSPSDATVESFVAAPERTRTNILNNMRADTLGNGHNVVELDDFRGEED